MPNFARLVSRSFSTRFGSFLDERSSLGANSKRGCFPLGNRFENTHVEATLNHPFPALVAAVVDAELPRAAPQRLAVGRRARVVEAAALRGPAREERRLEAVDEGRREPVCKSTSELGRRGQT